MKLTSEIIRKAHKMTREIKEEFPSVDYKFQFGLCMSYLLKEEVVEELRPFEKLEQICKENGWQAQINHWEKKDNEGNIIYNRYYYKAVWYTGNRHNSKRHEKGFGYWDVIKGEYSTQHNYTRQYNVYEY